jgi:SNF2 family DNA or RNA helicase
MLDFANARKHSLIYAGMGTGKTLFALTWLKQFDGLKLVIAPKPALVAWRDDLAEFCPDLQALILTKGNSKNKLSRIRMLGGKGDWIVVVNYETARLLPLDDFYFSAVVLDEGHRIGKYNSKQTLKLTRLLKDVPQKVLMTGTAYNDGYERLYSMIRFFNPEIPNYARAHPRCKVFGHYHDFLKTYCHTYEISRGVYAVTGYKHVDHLAATIKPFTLRVPKNVIKLPAVVERTYRVPLGYPLKTAYKQLDKESALEYDDNILTASHLLTKIIRLQQMATSGLMVSDDKKETIFKGVEQRVKTLQMLVEQINEPLVIFTRFKRDVSIIKVAIAEKFHYLTGDKDTHDAWRQGAGRILIANIGAGAEGVRLERARHMIFWSVGYSNTDFEQARSRVVRAGQQADTCFMHYIVSEGTIDEQIYGTLTKKDNDKKRLDEMLND